MIRFDVPQAPPRNPANQLNTTSTAATIRTRTSQLRHAKSLPSLRPAPKRKANLATSFANLSKLVQLELAVVGTSLVTNSRIYIRSDDATTDRLLLFNDLLIVGPLATDGLKASVIYSAQRFVSFSDNWTVDTASDLLLVLSKSNRVVSSFDLSGSLVDRSIKTQIVAAGGDKRRASTTATTANGGLQRGSDLHHVKGPRELKEKPTVNDRPLPYSIRSLIDGVADAKLSKSIDENQVVVKEHSSETLISDPTPVTAKISITFNTKTQRDDWLNTYFSTLEAYRLTLPQPFLKKMASQISLHKPKPLLKTVPKSPARSIRKRPSSIFSVASTTDSWIPDQQAQMCMICHVTKFSLFVRKHHCRLCGRVLCGDCSLFIVFGTSKLRSCLDCFPSNEADEESV